MMARSAPNEGERYFNQAATLRLSIQYNIEDFEFAQSGGRINYLMDANVVRFFMNPAAEKQHTSVFGASDKLDYSAATAIIAAEFMFSRRLAGQGNRPALITPGHGSDLVDIINGLRRTPTVVDIESVSDENRGKLDRLIDHFDRNPANIRAFVTELKRLVPNLVNFMHEGPGAEATHLLRLHDEDLLCPLELHPDATREILELTGESRRRTDNWVRRLNWESKRTRNERSLHAAEKVLRDAESLVQTMLLDEAAAKSGEKLQYVLVTADRVLIDAYARWYWTDRLDTAPNARFVLRTPLQYVPVLNVREMPNGIETSDAVARGRAALDDLLAGLRLVDSRYPHILSFQRLLGEGGEINELLEKLFGFNPFEVGPENVAAFKAMRNQWHELFRGGVILNFELIARRQQAEFSRLANLLRSSSDLRMAVHEDQLRILGEVEAAHLAFSTRINIRLLTRSDQDSARGVPRRAPLALLAKFPRIIGEIELEAALDRLASHDRAFTAQVSRALENEADYEALFFAACISHRCGQWAIAWHFATRALSRANSDPRADRLVGEIVYLRASATRYLLPSVAAVVAAFDGLDALILDARANGNALGRARSVCELTSLILVVLYASRLMPKERINEASHRAERYAPEFGDLLFEATDALEQERTMPPSAMRMLEGQIWANVLAADVLVHVVGLGHSTDAALRGLAPSPELIARAEAKLEATLNSPDCTSILQAEAIMSRWNRRLLRRGEARSLIDNLVAGPTGGALTELDKAELEKFREVLAPKRAYDLMPA